MRVIADPDVVGDGPIQAGRQQDIGAGELVAYQELTAIFKRDLDVT